MTVAVVLALCAGVYGFVAAKSSTIFPNVYVAGVNVGGMTKEEAVAAVNAAVASTYGSSALTVKLPDRTLTFAPEQTQIALDTESAVEQAWNYGREGGIFATLKAKSAAQNTEHYIDIETALQLDEDYIRTVIAETATDVKSDLKQSTVDIDEEAGQVVVHVGTSQRELDEEGLYEAVIAAFMNNDFSPLEFSYTEQKPEAVDLQAIYDQLCTNVEDAYYDAEKKEIVPEVVGYGFDVAAMEQKLAMAEEGSDLVIQLEEVLPEVTQASLEEKLFHDVLGEYDSEHVYNPGRTKNLELACQAIDGYVMNPGDVFSFNDVVGERTADKGYQAAIVYTNGGKSEAELGGGVCQVSSTIYMCTLLADLEIVERTEHMYLVTYVPRGMDATVYWGQLDFKFKNSTNYPLRIDASVSDGYVHIKLVGTKETDTTVKMNYKTLSTTNWEDEIEEDETKPADYKEVIQTPYTGYTVQTYKTYYDANGKELETVKVAYSQYLKRDRITVVGKQPEEPDEEDPNEATEPTEPTEPAEPTQPEVPDGPVEPYEPNEPNEPDTPEEPVQPDTPTEPSDPDAPTGENSGNEESGGNGSEELPDPNATE